MIPSLTLSATGAFMMGRQTVDQSQLFYLFNLEEHIPADHLLRRLIPSPSDQNLWAHWRKPMDMMRQG
jgi:hypothetical protein